MAVSTASCQSHGANIKTIIIPDTLEIKFTSKTMAYWIHKEQFKLYD